MRLSGFDWMIHSELRRLAGLERNWDAEGASPLEPAIIDAAGEFASRLPAEFKSRMGVPAVVPMRKGNLQFEWDDAERSLELEFETADTVRYLKWDPAAGTAEEESFDIRDTARAVAVLRWFLRDHTNA